MSDFCPDGYLPTADALAEISLHLFPDYFEQLEHSLASQPEAREDSGVEKLARALSVPPPPAELSEIGRETVDLVRKLSHQGELNLYYFDNHGRHTVPRDFLATPQADGLLETGVYWPFGQPSRMYEERPNYSVFVEQLELERLLNQETAETDKKRPLPVSMKSSLVEALRKLDHLPRDAQFKALQELPEFSSFKITVAAFREAARKSPRDPGRKSR
jgi:hypothetical protein